MARVEGDALLTTVVRRELNTHLPHERAGVSQVGAFAPLQLDHLGPHVPQDQSTPWRRLPAGQFQYPHAIQYSPGAVLNHSYSPVIR